MNWVFDPMCTDATILAIWDWATDYIRLFITTNPIASTWGTIGLTWLVAKTPWKWDDAVLNRLKRWKKGGTK